MTLTNPPHKWYVPLPIPLQMEKHFSFPSSPPVEPWRNEGRRTKAAAFPNDGKLLPLPPSIPGQLQPQPVPPFLPTHQTLPLSLRCAALPSEASTLEPTFEPTDCSSRIFNFSQMPSAFGGGRGTRGGGWKIKRKWTLRLLSWFAEETTISAPQDFTSVSPKRTMATAGLSFHCLFWMRWRSGSDASLIN